MPTLETVDGQPVAPVDPEAVNQAFSRAMADDSTDGEKAPPKRQAAAEVEVARPKSGRPPKAEKARTTARPSVVLDDSQRAQGVKGLAQVGAGVVLMVGKATGNDAFKADAVTIASSADEIADACVQTAKADARFAAALDKVCAAGPYAALIGVMVGVGSQIVRNHRPGLHLPGTTDPDVLLKAQNESEMANA